MRAALPGLTIVLAALCAACGAAFEAGQTGQTDGGYAVEAAVVDAGGAEANVPEDTGVGSPWVVCTIKPDRDSGPLRFGCGSGHLLEPDGATDAGFLRDFGGFNLQLSGIDSHGNQQGYGACGDTDVTPIMRCPLQNGSCYVITMDDAGRALEGAYGGTCEQRY